jgi:hypothetical protein
MTRRNLTMHGFCLVLTMGLAIMTFAIGGGRADAQTPPITDSDGPSGDSAAAASEDDFLRVVPLPDGLEDLQPIVGAVNEPFRDCSTSFPAGYVSYRNESVAIDGHAMRGDIYAYLRTRQAFDMRDCTCAGKVAPWEPVEEIYAALKRTHGEVLLKHTAVYEDQARDLRTAVERLCGGPF